MSFDGRPTSRRGSTSLPAQGRSTESQGDDAEYEPNLVDLIYAAGNIHDMNIRTVIPSTYLEAASVDSARVIGHGASFTASVRSLPPGPEFDEVTVDMGDWIATETSPARPRPKFIVYKTVRVAFDDAGDPLPGYSSALQSALTEFHALTYPALLQHPNIIAFLGLAWGSNEFHPGHRLPALVVEYAEHGTLADVLARGPVAPAAALSFCAGVADALRVIHEIGLIHGDIKAENVLICQGQQGMVAKLADFGYSVVQEAEQDSIWIGGTRPWKAPETTRAIPKDELKYTDVYSLGLLCWTVAINGMNPFRLILDEPTEEAIEALKNSNGLLAVSATALWIPKFMLYLLQQQLRQAQQLDAASAVLTQPTANNGGNNLTGAPITYIPVATMMSIVQTSQTNQADASSMIFDALQAYVREHVLLSKLDRIIPHSLGLRPESRNLGEILDVLRPDTAIIEQPAAQPANKKDSETKIFITNTGDKPRTFRQIPIRNGRYAVEALEPSSTGKKLEDTGSSPSVDLVVSPTNETTTITAPTLAAGSHVGPAGGIKRSTQEVNTMVKPSWIQQGFKTRRYSWQNLRTLEPRTQEIMHKTLTQITRNNASRFLLAATYMDGLGCQRDPQKSLELIRAAAEAGHLHSQSFVYRLHRANGIDDVPGFSLTQYLDPTARWGSRAAFLDLIAAEKFKEAAAVENWLNNACGGVGANWFYDINMLHGLTLMSYRDHDFLVGMARKLENINEYRVNRRGDTLLHLTAFSGQHKSRKVLVEELGADVNCRNHAGDTPLISICRAGNGGSAIVFLQNYHADASLAARNGETALHWLVSFHLREATVEPLARDLIAHGARVDAATTERVSHSALSGSIDFSFQAPGTPLAWAVHHGRPAIVRVLLSHGADPNSRPPGARLSPLEMAAGFKHAECLRIMLEHLEQRNSVVLYGPLFFNAIDQVSGPFSMMIWHREHYAERMTATLDVIRGRSEKLSNLVMTSGHDSRSSIYTVVAAGQEAVLQYMVDNKWLLEDINRPSGPFKRTPLLEAARWNRLPLVKLLAENGADIHARACNPFNENLQDQSALHVLANEGCTDETGLLAYLVASGVPVDGTVHESVTETPASPPAHSLSDAPISKDSRPGPPTISETAFSCALRNNAFSMCDELLRLGASPDALSTTAGFFTTAHPTTILGHTILSNARHIYDRLKYLLSMERVAFIVEPARKLTALHRAALGCADVMVVDGKEVKREEFDWNSNRAILRQLTAKFNRDRDLNAPCEISGRTALHLAVERGNAGAVEVLLDAGADSAVRDEHGHTPADLLGHFRSEGGSSVESNVWEKIATLLQ